MMLFQLHSESPLFSITWRASSRAWYIDDGQKSLLNEKPLNKLLESLCALWFIRAARYVCEKEWERRAEHRRLALSDMRNLTGQSEKFA